MWFWLGQWIRAFINISLDIFFLRLRDNAWHIWHKLVTWVIFPIMREDQSHNVMSEATGPASCDAPRPWLIFQPVNPCQPHHNRLLLHKGGTFSYFLIAKGVNNVIYWQSQYPINWRKSMWIWPDYSQARIRLGINYLVFFCASLSNDTVWSEKKVFLPPICRCCDFPVCLQAPDMSDTPR